MTKSFKEWFKKLLLAMAQETADPSKQVNLNSFRRRVAAALVTALIFMAASYYVYYVKNDVLNALTESKADIVKAIQTSSKALVKAPVLEKTGKAEKAATEGIAPPQVLHPSSSNSEADVESETRHEAETKQKAAAK